ncbi:hypothetical protein EOL96_09325 [Candidatus Saccharibacteria bacterium]|nr:hypothetical protein [Candidatus Saccharibacteria bacterium]
MHSHIWKIRQKVGHDLLVLPAVDIIAIDELQSLNLHQNMKNMIDAYLAYIDTGKYQVLEKQIDR